MVMTRQELRRWRRFCKRHANAGQRSAFLEKLIRERESNR